MAGGSSMRTHRANQILAVVLAVFSVWYLYEAFQIRVFPLPRPIDSDLFPKVLGLLMLGLAGLLFFVREAIDEAAMEAAPAAADEPESPFWQRPWTRIVVTAVAVAAYATALQPLGFVLASVLLVAGLTAYYGYKNHLVTLSVAIAVPLVFYLVLTRLMTINLPAGLLPI
jgi:putative tricarboxylic transport membrane protein